MTEERIASLRIWEGDVRIEPLSGGITNLNYRVRDLSGDYAARTGTDDPLLGISRHNEIECTRAAAELGIAPPLIYTEPGLLVSRFVDGAPLTPELARDEGRIAHVAARLHEIHAAEVARHLQYFSAFTVTRTYLAIAAARSLALPTADGAELRRQIGDLEARLEPFLPTFCHNDLMPGNLLDSGDELWVIDWEYAGFGHPWFDLAGFSSNCDFGVEHDALLLAAYFGSFSRREEEQFRILKAMASLRESLWAVVQAGQSTIAFNYAAYRDENYQKFCRALTAI